MNESAAEPKRQGLTAIALSNAASSWAARGSGLVVGLVLTPFVLDRIGRDLYGMVAASAAIFDYLWLLRAGLSGALRRYVTVSFHAGDRDLSRRYYRAGFWWSTIPRALVWILGLILARPICSFFRLPEHLHDDAAIGVALLVTTAALSDLCRILEVPVYATGKIASLSMAQVIRPVLMLGFVVSTFLLVGPSLTNYALSGALTQTALVVLLSLLAARAGTAGSPFPKPSLGDREIRHTLFSFGGLAVISQIATMLYVATDNVLIGRIYGAEFVTHYSLGVRWVPIITGFLWAAVSGLTPLLTQLDATGETGRSERAIRRAVAVSAGLSVPACLTPCVLGDLFLTHWVGPEYSGSAVYLIAMMIPQTIVATISPIWALLLAQGRIGRVAVADVALGVFNVGISLLLALGFGLGLLGFALGNTIANMIKSLLLRPLLGRGIPGVPSVWRLMVALPRALAGGAPALALLYFLRGWIDQSLASVLIFGIAGGILGLAGALTAALGPADLRVMVKAVRSVVARRR